MDAVIDNIFKKIHGENIVCFNMHHFHAKLGPLFEEVTNVIINQININNTDHKDFLKEIFNTSHLSGDTFFIKFRTIDKNIINKLDNLVSNIYKIMDSVFDKLPLGYDNISYLYRRIYPDAIIPFLISYMKDY